MGDASMGTSTAPGVSLRKIRSGMSPRDWRSWLNDQNAIAIFGAAVVRAEGKRLDKLRRRLASDVPSAAWLAAYDDSATGEGFEFPPGKGSATTHGARMVMSMVSGRYTPPQSLTLEDMLDAMTPDQAFWYVSPDGRSVSASVIERIGESKARPLGGQW